MNIIPRNSAWLTLVALSAAAFLPACGGSDTTGSGGSGATTSTGGTGGSTGGSETGGTGGGTGGSTPEGKADGEPCADNAECAGGFCLTQAGFGFPNGYCTGACNTFVTCADGSQCIYYANEPFCFKDCSGGDACGSGQQCLEVDPDAGLSVCAPGCTMDTECEGFGKCDTETGFCYVPEDCAVAGDEDGDGLSNCEDPDCSAACQGQIDAACGAAVIINATANTPVVKSGDNSDGTGLLAGVCSGGGNNEDLYSVKIPAGNDGVLHLALASATDLAMYIRSTCNAPSQEGCTDAFDGGTDEVLDVLVTAGQTLTVIVDGSSYQGATGNQGPYTLTATFEPAICGDGNIVGTEQCDDGNMAAGDGCDSCKFEVQTETEPNEDSATSSAVTLFPLNASLMSGELTAETDHDWYSVTLVAASTTLSATTGPFGADACGPDAGEIDTLIDIVAADGTTVLGSNDDISGFGNYCSTLELPALTAGTYYIHVRNSDLCSFAGDCMYEYSLQVEAK